MNVSDMLAELRKPVPEASLNIKVSDGERIAYLPWYKAVLLADDRLSGAWSHELVEHWIDSAARGSKVKGYTDTPLAHCRVRVTIHGTDRDVSREAIGVDDEPNGQRGTPLERAEAAGLRRALAKFGLGLELYNKDRAQASPSQQSAQRYPPTPTRQATPPAPAKPAAKVGADPHFTERIKATTTGAQVDELLRDIAAIENPHHRANAEKLAHARLVEHALAGITDAPAAKLSKIEARLQQLPTDTPGLNSALDRIIARSSELQAAKLAGVPA